MTPYPSKSVALRQRLVESLREQGAIETEAVAEAFLAVPREAFVPLASLEGLYRDVVVATKFDRLGRSVSSSSQPFIMARMLEMLRPETGQNVLEIGAATGYDAALLQTIVGRTGHVTTVEIQVDIASDARAHLHTAGFDDVEVVTGDGARGYQKTAPYDRIIVTASCSDLPLAWWDQMKPDGVLVVPLRRGSLQAVLALRRTSAGFSSERAVHGFFMSMTGQYAESIHAKALGPRKDILVSGKASLSGVRAKLLVELMNSPLRMQEPETLASALAGSMSAFRYFWDLRAFFATREPDLLEVQTRNAIYDFQTGLAILNTNDNSLAVLPVHPPFGPLGSPPSGDSQPKPKLLTFGGENAGNRSLQLVNEYVEMGKPTLDRLHVSLRRLEPPSRSLWSYELSYAPRSQEP